MLGLGLAAGCVGDIGGGDPEDGPGGPGSNPQCNADGVRDESRRAVTVMVGDGVYDGAALAAARVGVALGASGASAAAEAADAVLTVDRLDRLADAVEIARHVRRVALQTAAAGMVLARHRGNVARLLEGRENRRLLIWSLLSVEQWCDTFLGASAG